MARKATYNRVLKLLALDNDHLDQLRSTGIKDLSALVRRLISRFLAQKQLENDFTAVEHQEVTIDSVLLEFIDSVLTPIEKEVLILRTQHRESFSTIATRLQTTEKEIKNIYERSIRRLRNSHASVIQRLKENL
jgi:DNA-directed RNA polymerase sigma subunit (sigma70/sigma32)